MEYLVQHFTSKSVMFVIGAAWGWSALAYPTQCVQHNWRTLFPVLWLDTVGASGGAVTLANFGLAWWFVGAIWAAISLVSGFFAALLLAVLLGPRNDVLLVAGVIIFAWVALSLAVGG